MTQASQPGILRPPDAVLFDMDGVLVDTFDAWVAVLRKCRLRRGLAPLDAKALKACWGQGIQADCETLFPGESPGPLAREYDEEFERHVALVRPEDGVVETVRAIAKAGVRTAVVTNSPASLARRVVVRLGLDGDFDCVAAGDEVPRGKPDPALLLLALERLRTSPPRAVLVGDTTIDLEAARAAHVPMIGFRLEGADARVERLAELLHLLGLT